MNNQWLMTLKIFTQLWYYIMEGNHEQSWCIELLNPILWMFPVLNFGRRLGYVFTTIFFMMCSNEERNLNGCLWFIIQSHWFIAMHGNVLEVAKWAVSLKLDKCVVWAGLLQQQLLTRWHVSKATASSAPLWSLCLKPSHLIDEKIRV